MAFLNGKCQLNIRLVRGRSRYHGETVVKEDGRYIVSLEMDQKLYFLARLEIIDVQTTDSGIYRAIAKNKYGEGTATINLNFEGAGKPK